jgi:hypothetical protein
VRADWTRVKVFMEFQRPLSTTLTDSALVLCPCSYYLMTLWTNAVEDIIVSPQISLQISGLLFQFLTPFFKLRETIMSREDFSSEHQIATGTFDFYIWTNEKM